MRRKLWLGCVGVVLLAALVACGRKGAPRPPEEDAPLSVQHLTARGAVRTVSLSWQAPLATASGGELRDIARFIIQRRDVVGDKTNRFEDVGVIRIETEQKIKNVRFSFDDPSVVAGKKYDYIVFAQRVDGLDGETDKVLRVNFRGETSAVETLGVEALP